MLIAERNYRELLLISYCLVACGNVRDHQVIIDSMDSGGKSIGVL